MPEVAWSSTLSKRARRTLGTAAFCLTYAVSASLFSGAAPAFAAAKAPIYTLQLPHRQTAQVFANGVAEVYSADHRSVEFRVLPLHPQAGVQSAGSGLPDKGHLIAELAQGPAKPFEPGRVIVVFRPGAGPTQDTESIPASQLLGYRNSRSIGERLAQVAPYTADSSLNATLAAIGADRLDRLFSSQPRSALASLRSNAQARVGHQLLAIENAYRIHITGASVRDAVALLLKSPDVEYASPDWHVTTMHTDGIALPRQAVDAFRPVLQNFIKSRIGAAHGISPAALPNNYALSASAQSLLNTPSLNAAEAFDLVDSHYGQLPGQGVNITNVSLGDLDDASAASNSSDPCNFYASVFGPTTEIVGGQRYLNMPSMPLIPTFTADTSGNTNGLGEVCGVDPFLGEIGLDFSMMAPLPHALQRSGEVGSGYTDLLGVAPGANFRLVVPGSFSPTFSDIDAALLAAALQSPRPDVITSSLGFGEDSFGFYGRYLEDDPLSLAIVTSLVQNYNIVVCIAAGDGTRTLTTVAIGPSGGSAPTNVIPSGGQPTVLTDIVFSGAPSEDFDSGAIDAGGTTLDDIFSVEPQGMPASKLSAQHAFAVTRWNGFTSFSTGFGSRVNVSAPADNVLGFQHTFGGADDAVGVFVNGGTSASAPETAAAAAVAIQVARLTGHPFASATDVRKFLETTGDAVPSVPQADTSLNVGPQVNVGRAVSTLITAAGGSIAPSVARVAVEQRRDIGNLDGAFVGDTDPTNINLNGPSGEDLNRRAWITIAPDWEGVGSASTRYLLTVAGSPSKVLAMTPWARLLPATILSEAGLPVVSASPRTATLTYSAMRGVTVLASATFSLTFGPDDPTTFAVLAPQVPPVVTGGFIPVKYNLNEAADVSSPEVIVSEPGRTNPVTGPLFRTIYTVPISPTSGTVNIPVSALHGGGIYGIGIVFTASGVLSDFAFTRYAPAGANRPPAPTFSVSGSAPSHDQEISLGSSFQLNWDVTNVPGATGAAVEISAAGPSAFGIYNPFNNPNGTIRDHNGFDSGSIYYATLPGGAKGSVTLNGSTVGLYPTMNHVVRIIPLGAGGRVGEAGDVSTISMDGVRPADGGFVNNGYGVSETKNDGFLTSGQITASGQTISSVETFAQSTGSISKTLASTSNGNVFFTNGWGIYGGDIGLFGGSTATSTNYNLINSVTNGTLGAAWTPPSNILINEGAANQYNDVGAFEGVDITQPSTTWFRVFTSNITADTFGTPINTSAPISSFGLPDVLGMGENTASKNATEIAGDFFNFCGSPTIMQINLNTAAVTSFTGLGSGLPEGIAVDSGSNLAGVPTVCDNGFTIYNLTTKTGNEIILPGSNGLYTADDAGLGRFLVEETVSGDFQHNDNSLSSVLEYNDGGTLLAAHERFFLFNVFISINANNLQLNTAKKEGYMFGPGTAQLAPFSY